MIKKIFLTLVVVLISCAAKAQNFDYQARPPLDFSFKKANIELQVNPEDSVLRGSVNYTLKANINGAQQLTLNAPGITVDSMRADGQAVKFNRMQDSLNVSLTDSSSRSEAYHLKIFYHATPQFGLLKSSNGVIWSSLLPYAVSHWLPVKDHPRVEMITSLSLQVPAGYEAFASGVKTGRHRGPDSTNIITFRTGRAIPITDLSFGLGQFRKEGTSVGIKQIKSYAEQGSISDNKQRNLTAKAKDIISNIADFTGVDYPYQRLNIVILNDHHWEEKSYGAGTVFLYKNRGDWSSQLRRGIYGQWLGVYRHGERWADAGSIHFLQAALAAQLTDASALLKPNIDEPQTDFSTVYSKYSAGSWNFWQRYVRRHFANKKHMTAALIKQSLNSTADTITPQTLDESWYRQTGQPQLNLPSYKPKTTSTATSAGNDTVRYRVNYGLMQASNRLKLQFKAEQSALQQAVNIPIKIIGGGAAQPAEVSLSGTSDSMSVAIPAGTQNVYLSVPKGQKLVLDQHKPVSFLLYQLRNAEKTKARADAARQLGEHTSDPDLQLALHNVMQKNTNPTVKAALLQSYAAITHGAEGTQQQFLDALGSDNQDVQQAALQALSQYKSAAITQKLRAFSQNRTDTALSNRAMRMYLQRVDSSKAFSYTNTLVQQDTAGTRAIAAIGNLAAAGHAKKAVKYAAFYIQPVYDYAVRRQALGILIKADSSAKSWQKRLPMLLNDSDPRIRYLMAKSINEIPGADARGIIQSRLKKEDDARVYRVMNLEL